MSFGEQLRTERNTAYYCHFFSKLNVHKGEKKQPILLLSVIDLITQGLIEDNHIAISDELINTFKRHWHLLISQPFKQSDFALPFWHLQNTKGDFWHPIYNDKYKGRPQTINTLKDAVHYVKLDDELFYLLQDRINRQEIVDTLIATWFSSSYKKLEDILQYHQEVEKFASEEETKQKSDKIEDKKPKWTLSKSIIRDPLFRKSVIQVYNYKCAICELKVKESLTQNIVDGAHIKQFSQFYWNSITNGIALCKNHHWAFDKGWFYIDCKKEFKDYILIVDEEFPEEPENARFLKTFRNQKIYLPISQQYYPDKDALEWHRENVFKTSKWRFEI